MCEEKQRWVESFVWSRLVSTSIFVLQDQRIHPVDRPPSGLSHAQDSVSRVERRLGPDAYGSNPRTPRRRRRRAARIAGCSGKCTSQGGAVLADVVGRQPLAAPVVGRGARGSRACRGLDWSGSPRAAGAGTRDGRKSKNERRSGERAGPVVSFQRRGEVR